MVFKPMPMCMASHKLWGCSLPVHVYTNISHTYICTQACINLCEIYKIIYIDIHAHLYTHTHPHHGAH